jgi:hypothetical protein
MRGTILKKFRVKILVRSETESDKKVCESEKNYFISTTLSTFGTGLMTRIRKTIWYRYLAVKR